MTRFLHTIVCATRGERVKSVSHDGRSVLGLFYGKTMCQFRLTDFCYC